MNNTIDFTQEQLAFIEKVLKEAADELLEDVKKDYIPRVYVTKQLEEQKKLYEKETNAARKLFIEGGIFSLEYLLKSDEELILNKNKVQ